jgi:phage-related protein (TIGR01555 family)
VPKRTIHPDVKIAQDGAFYGDWDFCNGITPYSGYGEAAGFVGYAVLGELSQRPEYRMMVEVLARDMLREGWRLNTGGDGPKSKQRLAKIDARVKELRCRPLLKKAVELDGYFGRGHIFTDLKGVGVRDRKLPLVLDAKTVQKGQLRRFGFVEPIWAYPLMYNSNDPLRDDFFVPQTWMVMNVEVHRTRLMTIASRWVPDILKPAYAFGGLSLSQIARPYVDNWLRTRDSVGDIVHAFSLTILKTNLAVMLQRGGPDGKDLYERMDLFNALRDNRGIMAVDKDSEEVEQINTPLGELSDLQAQAQEQMCSISHTPVIKLLGLTPKGLNTSTDGEMLAWDDWVAASQVAMLDEPLHAMLQLIQLDLFGEVDPDIGHEWLPLRQMDDEAMARIRKTSAEADDIYLQAGVVAPEEVRGRLVADRSSGYNELNPDELPEPPEHDDEGDPPPGTKPGDDDGEDD